MEHGERPGGAVNGVLPWIPRVTVVLRPAAEGGYEAVATEGVPHRVQIRAHSRGVESCSAYSAYHELINALVAWGFDGEIVLEDRSRPGRVTREVLTK